MKKAKNTPVHIQNSLTAQVEEQLNEMIESLVDQERMEWDRDNCADIRKKLSDRSYEITPDYYIRRYLQRNEKKFPSLFEGISVPDLRKERNVPWSDAEIDLISKRLVSATRKKKTKLHKEDWIIYLSELYSKRGIKELGKISRKAVLKLAVALGMSEEETIGLLLAFNKDPYSMRSPLDALCLCFQSSQEPFTWNQIEERLKEFNAQCDSGIREINGVITHQHMMTEQLKEGIFGTFQSYLGAGKAGEELVQYMLRHPEEFPLFPQVDYSYPPKTDALREQILKKAVTNGDTVEQMQQALLENNLSPFCFRDPMDLVCWICLKSCKQHSWEQAEAFIRRIWEQEYFVPNDRCEKQLSLAELEEELKKILAENTEDEDVIQTLKKFIQAHSKSFYVYRKVRKYKPLDGYSRGRMDNMRLLSQYLREIYPDYKSDKGEYIDVELEKTGDYPVLSKLSYAMLHNSGWKYIKWEESENLGEEADAVERAFEESRRIFCKTFTTKMTNVQKLLKGGDGGACFDRNDALLFIFFLFSGIVTKTGQERKNIMARITPLLERRNKIDGAVKAALGFIIYAYDEEKNLYSKLDMIRKGYDHILKPLNYPEIYMPNMLDRFFLLSFMGENPNQVASRIMCQALSVMPEPVTYSDLQFPTDEEIWERIDRLNREKENASRNYTDSDNLELAKDGINAQDNVKNPETVNRSSHATEGIIPDDEELSNDKLLNPKDFYDEELAEQVNNAEEVREDAERYTPQNNPDSEEKRKKEEASGKTELDFDNPENYKYKIDSLVRYLEELKECPVLSREEEQSLARLAHEGSEDAKAKFISSNLRLVVWVAKQYKWSGIPLLDLIQAGNMVLQEVLDDFDETLGYKFSTYATKRIHWAIQKEIATHTRVSGISFEMRKRIRQIVDFENTYEKEHGGKPTDEMICESLGLTKLKLMNARNAKDVIEIVSIDKPVGGDDTTTVGDLIADPNGLSPKIGADKTEIKRILRSLPRELDPWEAKVLELRTGLFNGKQYTLEQISDLLNIEQSTVNEIEINAMRNIKKTEALLLLMKYR